MFYNFNQSIGSVVNDLSGNGNDGTIYGGASLSSSSPLQSPNNCVASDSVYVDVNSLSVDLGTDTTLCPGDSIQLDAGLGYSNYLWSTVESTQIIYVSDTGIYNVAVGNGTLVGNSHSLSFDGNDFIDFGVGGYPSGNAELTLIADIYINSTPNNVQYIMSFGGGNVLGDNMALGIYGNSGIFATFTGSNFDVISGVPVPTNGWHNVVAVHKQNGQVELYLRRKFNLFSDSFFTKYQSYLWKNRLYCLWK